MIEELRELNEETKKEIELSRKAAEQDHFRGSYVEGDFGKGGKGGPEPDISQMYTIVEYICRNVQ